MKSFGRQPVLLRSSCSKDLAADERSVVRKAGGELEVEPIVRALREVQDERRRHEREEHQDGDDARE
jgi:hypothetical protein